MRAESLGMIGVVALVASAFVMTIVSKAQEQSSSDAEEILTIHEGRPQVPLRPCQRWVAQCLSNKVSI